MTNLIITAYCLCLHCCSDGDGLTASMRPPVEGRTIAMNGVPFGTKVLVPGVGWRVVEDRMPGRYGTNRIDVYMKSHKKAKKFGVMNR